VWIYTGEIMPPPKKARAEGDFSGMSQEQIDVAKGRPAAPAPRVAVATPEPETETAAAPTTEAPVTATPAASEETSE
jgi:hypothetical protein